MQQTDTDRIPQQARLGTKGDPLVIRGLLNDNVILVEE